jgi:hypothetical protein
MQLDALMGSDPQLRDTVLLLTSEVVTNAALHTGSRFEVRVTPLENGEVRVRVNDVSTKGLLQAPLAPLECHADAATSAHDKVATSIELLEHAFPVLGRERLIPAVGWGGCR